MSREALDFLLTRRSRPAKLLSAPAPGREELTAMLTAAARVPDHGKLEPWRFVVLEGEGLARFAAAIRARAGAAGQDPDKGALAFEQAPLVVAVVSSPKPSDKIPAIEQTLSGGAVALSLLNAALAAGWGASWMTGWAAYDRPLLEEALRLAPGESVIGYIYLGTCATPPPDRPRPDVAALTTWVDM
jgi:nitroreductase